MSTEETKIPIESAPAPESVELVRVRTPEEPAAQDVAPVGNEKRETPERSIESSIRTKQFRTIPGYRLFVLVTLSFVVSKPIFIFLYLSVDWFSVEILWFFLPIVLACLTIAHFILTFLESPTGCRVFAPIAKGRPIVIYRNWLLAGDSTIALGRRQIAIDLIDEVWLTFWGNLHLRSRTIRGEERLLTFRGDETSDLLFKLPFGIITLDEQRQFIDLLRARKPSLVTNKRLERRLSTPILPKAELIPFFGSLFMLAVFFDYGQAVFGHLDLLKHYHLAALAARDGNKHAAESQFNEAEQLRNERLKWSLVYWRFMVKGRAEFDTLVARGEALARMKRYKEALDTFVLASDQVPGSLSTGQNASKKLQNSLRIARLQYEMGDFRQARLTLLNAIDSHKDSFLARLYLITLYKRAGNSKQSESFYRIFREDIKDKVFGDEPVWPPGGNSAVHDYWYSEDIDFVFDKLLKQKE